MPTLQGEGEPRALYSSAELVLDFLNTRGGDDKDPDGLDSPNDLIQWARGTGFPETNFVVTSSDVLAAREFRDALEIILESHAHQPEHPQKLVEAEALLGRFSELHPLKAVLSASAWRFEATQTGIAGALARVLVAAAAVAGEGAWPRMKSCNNPTCHTAFFDQTKNGSGRYCSSNCTSKVSMRAYRARQKAARTPAQQQQ